ncbi:tripartite tricarboxylate transporter substrate binding protein [Diaphorobacter sp.]|uniref:Bug family tripartite tricarboxylate transporter substrate binding protein n=1 Tax=Diaphorobacter sp. TaxID=1934310 RepID=UPI0028AD68C7|nr:tripartite tricarboxylate transporter substrate binding protein [Diaphorobacter sp.]
MHKNIGTSRAITSARRRTLALAAGLLATATFTPHALAQNATGNWPAKPITFVVPQAPGGANDVIARAVAQGLENTLGQPVIVDNRPGANGNLGTSQVARSAGDGYTWLVTAQSAYTINPALYASVPFDPIKDFTPVMQLAVAPYLLVVNPKFPAKNLDELVAYAKAHPGKVEFASAGNGTLNHLLGEMLKKQRGVDLLHVPYKGAAAAATDVVAGQLPMTFGSFPGVMPFVSSGKLRVLGVASDHPTSLAPDITPLGKDLAVTSWYGLFAPAGTPKSIVDKVYAAVSQVLATPAMQERLKTLGAEGVNSNPDSFKASLPSELAYWKKVVKDSGAHID